MEKELDEQYLEEYSRLDSLFKGIDVFIKRHPSLTYIEFDYYTVHDLTLFSVEPNFDFDFLAQTIKKLNEALPHIKKIFSKPIINLKDRDDILPVESVRIINQRTMQNLACHSEYVDNITEKGIKPRKLLTQIYEDDYSIYENVVFCNLVDEILKYIRKTCRTLRDLVYANDVLGFNLLERVNHIDYFLALGKLHTGYIRDFEKYYSIGKSSYYNLQSIAKKIQPRLNTTLYKKNKLRNHHLPIKKTNIFLMQKDYHQVYSLYKYFEKNHIIQEKEEYNIDFDKLEGNYTNYVEIMTIFAAGHFNFKMDPTKKMRLNKLDADFTFKKWNLHIKKLNKDCLLLEIKKNSTYRIVLVSSINYEYDETLLYLGAKEKANETLICSPFEQDYETSKTIYISMESVESFRRLQQIILRGMIYSDSKHTDCPFCEDKMIYNEKNHDYECPRCQTVIKKATCNDCHEYFYYTDILNYKDYEIRGTNYSDEDKWLYNRKIESGMFFRNITKINNKKDIICPHCGKVYNKEE